MKKFLLIWAFVLTAIAATAQEQDYMYPSVWSDNWYVGVHGGINSKVTNNDFLTNLNSHAALRIGRDFNPYFGLMVEGTLFFGDNKFGYSEQIVKAYNIDLLGSVSLVNLLGGFKGKQRIFETKFIFGPGMNHIVGLDTDNNNDLIAKLGFEFVFHFDKIAALEFYLQPAINFNLDHYSSRTQFNVNYSAWQLAIGINYRFKNSNGTHYFAHKDPEIYIIELNDRINELRQQVEEKK
ncbi:MAG: hypothetical protein J6U14_09310 [Bacteroidaceae bacterium]|nr:hypothetical protein [Bacteroidaceae bacterium]